MGLFEVSKLDKILELVSDYITEQQNTEWKPGEDWIAYSGPVYDDEEYVLYVIYVGIFGERFNSWSFVY